MKIDTLRLWYVSPVFHTRALVRALGRALAERLGVAEARERDATPWAAGEEPSVLAPSDLAILGVPVYGGRVPAPALERLPRAAGSPAVLLVSYGNRAFEDALLELRDGAVARGFRPIAAAACVAEHTIAGYAAGRPDAADMAALEDFARAVASLVRQDGPQFPPEPDIPGNRPYRKFSPSALPQQVSAACSRCGLCARQCPTGAIAADEPASVDAGRCICCMRCVTICPERARQADAGFLAALTARLAPLCAERKENAFFLPEQAQPGA